MVGDDDLAGLFMGIPLHRRLGVTISRSPGGIRLTGLIGEDWARFDGATELHGGVVAALLDSAATFCLLADTGRVWATVDLRIDYLRPAAVGHIEVVAAVVRAGRTVARAHAELRDAGRQLCATTTGTFAAQQAAPAKRGKRDG